jgi:hypothetical protein
MRPDFNHVDNIRVTFMYKLDKRFDVAERGRASCAASPVSRVQGAVKCAAK